MRAYAEGVVLLILGLVAILGVWNVPAANDNETWAGIVPFGAGLGIVAISVFMLLGARKVAISGVDQPRRDNRGTLSILGLFAIALVYQQSIRWFGYQLPTAIVAPLVLYIFGVRSWVGLAASVILCPLIYHIIFFEILGVFPPFGEVFDLIDAVRG